MKGICSKELRKELIARGVNVPPAPPPSSNRLDLEREWLDAWTTLGYPPPHRQYRFHPTRKWAFDFAWPASLVAVDVQGGLWNKGAHVRGLQYAKDRVKIFSASEMGWLVYEVTNVKDCRLMDRIKAQIDKRKER